MQKKLFFVVALFWTPLTFCQQSGKHSIQVQLNRNVELLGFVYFLGYEGNQSETDLTYSIEKKKRYAYGLSLYQQYKTYKNSKPLSVIVGFAENIWLDYLISLLIQLEDFPYARLSNQVDEKYYLRFSPANDPVEARHNVSLFIDAMNKLYREVDFDKYFSRYQKKYENAITQVKNSLPDKRFIPAMENFYGQSMDYYFLIPSLTIPAGMGFGVKYSLADTIRAFHVFGTFGLQHFADDTDLDMGFNDRTHLLELSTHEFGHSFVNQAVDKVPEELIAKTEKLFEPIKSAMSNQGYTGWKACLYEHFVRAGEVMIARNLGNISEAERLKTNYIEDRKFVYLPVILEEFEIYNKSKLYSYTQTVENAMRKLFKKVSE